MTAAAARTTPIDFTTEARRAMADPVFQGAVGRAVHLFRGNRARVLAELPQWEEWREQARAIKAHTLAHLDYYLDLLDRRIRAAGGQVHWAAEAAEARAIILDLARRHNVRRVAKSKSSVTSEIALNPALEATGIDVTETDLGEFIVQLAGEEPSHFVVPAIHKDIAQVAALFSQHLDLPPSDDPAVLTEAARLHLRRKFLEAEMGISGVNFAVAESGTIVLFENEGNARMVTTLPRLHVAVMGIEKVVPRLADLAVMLRVLPLSAVGAWTAEYISLITGPARRGEADGPAEFHLVILDNGRSRILADREMREALQCIRCAACLNVCPVYEHAGGYAYGSIYSGPIGAVLTPLFQGTAVAGTLPFASSLCGACAEVCPVKIDIPRLLVTLRRRTVGDRLSPAVAWWERWAMHLYAAAATSERRWRWAGKLFRAALRPFVRGGTIRRLPFPLSAWTRSRDFPAPPRRAYREEKKAASSRSATGDRRGT